MTQHPDIATLNDLVDGELDDARRAEVEAHLEACLDCRREWTALEKAVKELRGLPAVARVPPGLWESVRARMGDAPAAPTPVLDFPTRTSGRTSGGRVTLSWVQLAAAAAVVAFLSAGTAWMALRTGGTRPGPEIPPVATTPTVASVRAAGLGTRGYEEAVRELETLVDRGRDVLTPETVATLEESLATVDAALADVRTALAEDPGSELLRRMLVSHQTARLRVLRQAATVIEARS